MQDDKLKNERKIYPDLEPAYSILNEISEHLESAGEKQEYQSALESSLDQYDLVKDIFLAESQSWAAAWVNLKKASLHIELAQMANAMGRAVQVHTSLELINDVLTELPSLSPSLELTAKLYIAMIDTLFRIRPFFEKPEQLEALDDLIRGVAESLGEAQALNLSYRTQANDLNFTAGILENLVALEEDPKEREKLEKSSLELYELAADLSAITSAPDLTRIQEGK